MKNDPSRHWTMLSAAVPGELLTAQAQQAEAAGLAGVADGLTSHPIWSVDWALRQGQAALAETLKGTGRDRRAFHRQAGFFVAVGSDTKQAVEDAKATVALYAGVEQYEPFFAAHGFGAEARACQAAVQQHDVAGAGAAAVTDEMAATFVIAGTPDECRCRLEPIWDVADSFLLVPPFLDVPLGAAAVTTFHVSEADTAAAMGHPDPSMTVLGSPRIGLWFELASPLMPAPGGAIRHVGVGLVVHHLAAAFVGEAVAIEARVVDASGRAIVFSLEATVGERCVARGVHHRRILEVEP